MGNTGSSTAQHLHFEIHKGRWETGQPNAVDPLLYLSFPEVRYLQEKLNDIGYKLVEDGINGNNTIAAVKDFQRKQKLVVDGNAGPSTLAQILKVFALANSPKPANTSEVEGVSKLEEYKKEASADKSFVDAQKYVKERGISDGTYPQRPVTRQEVWAMIKNNEQNNR
jgi:peptidoglycan hydrolase-like protein with peptidoglycan-binding domain